MSIRSNKNKTTQKWYEEPVKKWFSIISGFIFIAGIGYTFASIQFHYEFRMAKLEMKQEFNETLRKQIDDCKTEKQNIADKRVEAIESVVKKLEQRIDGKQQ